MTFLELLKTPETERNFSWEENFFKLFCDQSVRLLSQDPQQGPDGWPYLICETISPEDPESKSVFPIESAQKLFAWLADKGIGLVVNPMRESYPDYVFSYGMIWSFRETGYFIKPNNSSTKKSETATFEEGKIFATEPDQAWLPNYVKKVLKEFFRDQGVLAPKVLLTSSDKSQYDLCFSLESLGNPPQQEHEGVAEAIAWFLPPHYSIVLISEKGLPQFFEL